MVYRLVNRCFCICCNWSMFHSQLTLTREIFQKNEYPENLIDRCLKLFLNRIHILQENVPTVEEKSLLLIFHYLGAISLQTRAGLEKSIKGILIFCKLQLLSKVEINPALTFALRTLFSKLLHQVWLTILLQRLCKAFKCKKW